MQNVLAATIAELAAVGYGELRIERVAARAGVNKTSIYRRWPTRAELVNEALLTTAIETITVPDTGTLGGDLMALLRETARPALDPQQKGIVRVLVVERMHPELSAITRALGSQLMERYTEIIHRAIARGEVPAGSDAMLIIQTALAPVHSRILEFSESVDEGYLEAVVSLVLHGALAGGALPPATV